jgi:acyl carrier protein
MKIENLIKIIIKEIKNDIDIQNINNNSHLKNDLGLDSFNLALMTVKIEDEYGVDIFADGIVTTFGEIIEILNTK